MSVRGEKTFEFPIIKEQALGFSLPWLLVPEQVLLPIFGGHVLPQNFRWSLSLDRRFRLRNWLERAVCRRVPPRRTGMTVRGEEHFCSPQNLRLRSKVLPFEDTLRHSGGCDRVNASTLSRIRPGGFLGVAMSALPLLPQTTLARL